MNLQNNKIKIYILVLTFCLLFQKICFANKLSENEITDITNTIITYQNEMYFWYNKMYFNVPFNKKVSVLINKWDEKREKYDLYLYYSEGNKIITNRYLLQKNGGNNNTFYNFEIFEINNKRAYEFTTIYQEQDFKKWINKFKNNYKNIDDRTIVIRYDFKIIDDNTNNTDLIDGIKQLFLKTIKENDQIKANQKNFKIEVQSFSNSRYSMNYFIKKGINVFYNYNNMDLCRVIIVYNKDINMDSIDNYVLTKQYYLIFSDQLATVNKIYSKDEIIKIYKKNKYYYEKFKKYKKVINIKFD